MMAAGGGPAAESALPHVDEPSVEVEAGAEAEAVWESLLEVGRHRALRAETRAAFPGLSGRAYEALMIGTRAHVLAAHRLLSAVRAGSQAQA